MRFLLDTGIAADFINARGSIRQHVREAVLAGDVIGIGTPVLAELWYGVEHSQHPEPNRKRLVQHLQRLRIWSFDARAAKHYGELAAELRGIGRPMQQIDIQVAAIALSLGQCVVVSKDSDLKAVPGLDVEDWSIKE